MARKKTPQRPPGKRAVAKTSLNIDAAVYGRALQYKVTLRLAGTPKDLGDIVSEALGEYLKNHGA